MGIIFDIVQVCRPSPGSFKPSSEILVEFHSSQETAETRCELFNEKRSLGEETGFYFRVEEHDEESTNRKWGER